MQIAVLSDIHDNLWNLQAALRGVESTDALLCCGDLCSPFVIDQLAKFPKDIHIVFGNNDADLYRIARKASTLRNCHLYGEWFETVFDGRRIAMNHFDFLARPIAESGSYDVVCFGHNHVLEISRRADCLLINPGPIMGAKFSSGWQDVTPSFAVYDTTRRAAEAFGIDPVTKTVAPLLLPL